MKKTFSQKETGIICKAYLGLIVLILFGIKVNAQEYTKIATNTKSTNSIVRSVNSTDRLVYNQYFSQSAFMMYTDNGSTTQDLYLPDDVNVSDFIIRDGMVYFCGNRLINGQNMSIMGYFSLTNFPYTTVYYHPNNDFTQFDKIDFYKIYSESEPEVHIVMTAKNSHDQWTLVDAYPTLNNSWMFIFLNEMEDSLAGHEFYDIAVTDNYVVATSSKRWGSIVGCCLWYCTKPSVPGHHAFEIDVRRIWHPMISGKMIVAHWKNNMFATATFGRNHIIQVDVFNSFFHMQSFCFSTPFGTHLHDMNYNTDNDELDLFFRDSPNINHIFHFPMLGTGPIGTMSAHEYSGFTIFDIDYLANSSGWFVTTGVSNPNEKLLRLYKYKYDNYGDCTTQYQINTSYATFNKNALLQNISYWGYAYWRNTMATSTGTSPLNWLCEPNEEK